MGIRSWSTSPNDPPLPGEPNPLNFKILGTEEIDGWTIAVVVYPNCTTYEGKKLLVYPCRSDEVRAQKYLDPHFSAPGTFSPVARFEPTQRGYDLAKIVCRCQL